MEEEDYTKLKFEKLGFFKNGNQLDCEVLRDEDHRYFLRIGEDEDEEERIELIAGSGVITLQGGYPIDLDEALDIFRIINKDWGYI